MSGLIRYPAYRDFDDWRVATNDHIQALTLAARITSGFLDHEVSTPGAAHLPGVFPLIEGVQRLNVPLSKAASMMRDSERFLAYFSIPFCLSVTDLRQHRINGTIGVGPAARPPATDRVPHVSPLTIVGPVSRTDRTMA